MTSPYPNLADGEAIETALAVLEGAGFDVTLKTLNRHCGDLYLTDADNRLTRVQVFHTGILVNLREALEKAVERAKL